ncbi:MAG: hypothetical protein PF518_09410 [Spirochaetaceae bacterium]|jgi:hypothetical protein|nr:hypothetical protein [Spirochaetaceae bacterium]
MTFKPIYIKVILIFILFIAGLTGVADYSLNTMTGKWDTKTDEHLNELLVSAGTAYGVSRGLNAVISVIQASDINIVIGNLALGEALDPVNDIVEKFSNVMLLSITSLGIQKFIYKVGMTLGVNLFFTLAVLFFLTSAIFESLPNLKGEKVMAITNTLGTSMLVLFLLIRFIIPTVALFSMESTKLFGTDISAKLEKLEEIKTKTQLEYTAISEELNPIDSVENEKDETFFTRITDTFKEAGKRITDTFNMTKVKKNINRVIESLQESIEYITDLIVIFIIQTIVIPILTFFLLKASFQPLLALFFSAFKKEKKQEHIYSRS